MLLDTEIVSFRRRRKNLFRNIRANGWSYVVFRIVNGICTATSAAVNNAAVSHTEVRKVLKEAFPISAFPWRNLGQSMALPFTQWET